MEGVKAGAFVGRGAIGGGGARGANWNDSDNKGAILDARLDWWWHFENHLFVECLALEGMDSEAVQFYLKWHGWGFRLVEALFLHVIFYVLVNVYNILSVQFWRWTVIGSASTNFMKKKAGEERGFEVVFLHYVCLACSCRLLLLCVTVSLKDLREAIYETFIAQRWVRQDKSEGPKCFKNKTITTNGSINSKKSYLKWTVER